MASADELGAFRRECVEMLALLPKSGNILQLQRKLVEGHSLSLNPSEPVEELKRHQDLLRIVGDGLAWRVLGQHTIRTLSNHPGIPASVSSGGEDFEFTMRVAEEFYSHGAVPIVCDLTNLLLIGDLIAVTPDGISIVECKNTRNKRILGRSGRIARQKERGRSAAIYLTDSVQARSTGKIHVAIDANMPDPVYSSVSQAIREADQSTNGAGSAALGERDYVTIFIPREDYGASRIGNLVGDRETYRMPVAALHTILIREPSWIAPPVTAYELDAESQVRLLESDLIMTRTLDLAIFEESIDSTPSPFRVARRMGSYELAIHPYENERRLSSRFIDTVLLSPTPTRAMRNSLATWILGISESAWHSNEDAQAQLALAKKTRGTGTPAIFLTALRGDSDEVLIATQVSDIDDSFPHVSPLSALLETLPETDDEEPFPVHFDGSTGWQIGYPPEHNDT